MSTTLNMGLTRQQIPSIDTALTNLEDNLQIKTYIGTDLPTGSIDAGTLFYHTSKKKLYQYNGVKWINSFGGGISVWDSTGEYDVDNCAIYKKYIYRCIVKHTETGKFNESQWEHVGGYAGSLWKWDKDNQQIIPKDKDEIAAVDLHSDDATIESITKSYIDNYLGVNIETVVENYLNNNKEDLLKNYISRTEVEENYIKKTEVEENYIKNTDLATKTSAGLLSSEDKQKLDILVLKTE